MAILGQILHKIERHGVLAVLLLLLLGQAGAQWHSYAHGEAGAHEIQGQSGLASHGVCGDCLSFSPAVGRRYAGRAPAPSIRTLASTPCAWLASLLVTDLSLAFRSRAPPR